MLKKSILHGNRVPIACVLVAFICSFSWGNAQSWSGSENDAEDLWRSGNVGIGTTSPNYPLDVNGAINASDILVEGESIVEDFTGENATLTNLHVTEVLEIGPHSINMGVVNTGNTTYENHLWTSVSGFPGIGETFYINDGQAVGTANVHHTLLASNGARGYVGIGLGAGVWPGAKLHINNDYAEDAIRIERNMAGDQNNNWHETIVKIGISSNSAQSGLRFQASGDNAANFSDVLFLGDGGLVGIGTTDPLFELDIAGTARACEILVHRQWCDYVFESDYDLMPLNELANYIKSNKHLPGIPSAKEVEAEGLKMGDMQVKMMEKIEELTLYVLEMEADQRELRSENGELRSAIESLKKGAK